MTIDFQQITTFTAIEKKKQAQSIANNMKRLREDLIKQRDAWRSFKNSADILEAVLTKMSNELEENWHDADTLRRRVQQNKLLLEQIEQATDLSELSALYDMNKKEEAKH